MEEGPQEQRCVAMAIGQIVGPEARAANPFLEALLRSSNSTGWNPRATRPRAFHGGAKTSGGKSRMPSFAFHATA
jgi:hypothetical protein